MLNIKDSKKTKVINVNNKSFFKKMFSQRQLILMSFPFVIYIIIFKYLPLVGWVMAFQEYKPQFSMFEQQWVGLQQFKWLFEQKQFYLVLRNTLAMAILNLTFVTLATITLAILLNEIQSKAFKRTIQTISYLPHFLSWVIVVSLLRNVLHMQYGILNQILLMLGILEEPTQWLAEPKYFWTMVTVTHVWKNVGFGAIIYLASIASIDPQLYEAAEIDGARRDQKIFHVTIPGMKPTIFVLLIMNIGKMLTSAGFEIQYLLGSGLVKQVSETLQIFTLKYGIELRRYSFATAAGIFSSAISIALLLIANYIANKFGEESLM